MACQAVNPVSPLPPGFHHCKVNRVLYKVALVPLGDYVFFLAQFTTFGAQPWMP